MVILHSIYLILFSFGVIHFVVTKSTVDGFSVAFGGLAFYYLPALLGRGVGPLGAYRINTTVYIFGCLLIIGLVVADRIFPRPQFELDRQLGDGSDVQNRIIVFANVLSVILLLLTIDLSWIGEAKRNIPNPIMAKVLRYTLPIGFISAWIKNDRVGFSITAILLVFYTILFQVRSPITVALIGVFLYELHVRAPTAIGRIRIGTAAMVGGISVVLFDKIKGQVLNGNLNILLNFDRNIRQVVWNNNAHVVFQTLNQTVGKQFRLANAGEHLVVNFLSVVPLDETLFGVPSRKFSVIIKPIAFPGREAGVGSNIWAEAYAVGGAMGLLVGSVVFFIGLAILSAQLNSKTWEIRLFGFSVLPYWAFFNHRLTLGAILSTTSIVVTVCLVPRIGVFIKQRVDVELG